MVGGKNFHVGGISAVATLPEYRGRGLATQAVSIATQFIKDELKLEFCILTTGSYRRTFYEALGWQTISEPMYFDQPSGRMKTGASLWYCHCLTNHGHPVKSICVDCHGKYLLPTYTRYWAFSAPYGIGDALILIFPGEKYNKHAVDP